MVCLAPVYDASLPSHEIPGASLAMQFLTSEIMLCRLGVFFPIHMCCMKKSELKTFSAI